MANSQIDVTEFEQIDDVTKTAAGTVTNDVRVVLKTGISKEAAYVTLTSIRDAIVSGRITLE
jgi:hypothetical protein